MALLPSAPRTRGQAGAEPGSGSRRLARIRVNMGLTDSSGAPRRSWESEEQVEKAEKRSLTGKESGDQLKDASEGIPACHHQDFPMGSFI